MELQHQAYRLVVSLHQAFSLAYCCFAGEQWFPRHPLSAAVLTFHFAAQEECWAARESPVAVADFACGFADLVETGHIDFAVQEAA